MDTAYATLERVNTPPAQTWTYLKFAEATLRLPVPTSTGEVPARLPQLFGTVEDGIGPEATQWVERSAGDSHYIEVPRNAVRERPIVLEAEAARGAVRDTGVMLREGSEATVVLVSRGTNDAETTSATLARIVCEGNVRLTVVEIVALGEGGTHLEGLGIAAGAHTTVKLRQYALGGRNVALGLGVSLLGDGARLELETRYFARGQERLDVNHVVRQRGHDTRADLHARGLLDDGAHKTMRETIDLAHGAKGSRGNETETVLVLGDDVVNKTLPVILCDEDDVQGNHGASIGSVGPEQMGYLANRGLAEDEAYALHARAIFDDAVIHARCDTGRDAVLTRARAVLGDEIAGDLAEALEL